MRADDPDVHQVEGPVARLPAPAAAVIEALAPRVTERRLQRLQRVVAGRSRHLVPVLDRLVDPHNVSAVLRSAEAFGLLEVHAVPGPNGLPAAHRVSKGTHRWLEVHRHVCPKSCLRVLRARGYRVAVASMEGRVGPERLAELGPLAVVFGNEHAGVDPTLRAEADVTYAIPMQGFVESLNVSVAAAITFYAARGAGWPSLSRQEQQELLARYLLASVRDAEAIVRRHVAATAESR